MFECNEGVIKAVVYLGIVKEDRLLLVRYEQPPNPLKLGWWIPAPELTYGQDPKNLALSLGKEFGVAEGPNLIDVESFETPGGWHLVYHFLICTHGDVKTVKNIKDMRWVLAEELTDMPDMAHGKWEINTGLMYLIRARNSAP